MLLYQPGWLGQMLRTNPDRAELFCLHPLPREGGAPLSQLTMGEQSGKEIRMEAGPCPPVESRARQAQESRSCWWGCACPAGTRVVPGAKQQQEEYLGIETFLMFSERAVAFTLKSKPQTHTHSCRFYLLIAKSHVSVLMTLRIAPLR